MASAAPAADKGRPVWLPFAPYAFLGLWSGGYVMAVVGLESASWATMLALRYLTALVLVVPFLPLLSVSFPRDGASLGLIALIGFLIHVVHFSCSWIALASGVPLAVVALVLSLQPVLTALLAPRLAGQKVAGRVWLGLVLGLAGAAVVILSRGEIGAFPLPALLIVFGALAAFTTATLLDRRFGGKHHPVAVNTIQFAVAAACTVPMAILLEGFRFELTVGLVAAVGYLAVGTSLVALSLFLVMVRYGEAARVASLLYLVPPIAALLGWVFLGQAVPPILWAGMALASCGVWLAMRAPPAEPITRARP